LKLVSDDDDGTQRQTLSLFQTRDAAAAKDGMVWYSRL